MAFELSGLADNNASRQFLINDTRQARCV